MPDRTPDLVGARPITDFKSAFDRTLIERDLLQERVDALVAERDRLAAERDEALEDAHQLHHRAEAAEARADRLAEALDACREMIRSVASKALGEWPSNE